MKRRASPSFPRRHLTSAGFVHFIRTLRRRPLVGPERQCLRPKNPSSPLPLQPKHLASPLSLRHSAHRLYHALRRTPAGQNRFLQCGTPALSFSVISCHCVKVFSFSKGLSLEPIPATISRGPNRIPSPIPVLRIPTLLLFLPLHSNPPQQQPAQPAGKQTEPQTPAQIELLETKNSLETNGDSRKEVHTRVKSTPSSASVIRTPQFRLQPLLRIHRPPARPDALIPARHSRYSSSAIADNPHPRRHKRPRLSRRPHQSRPHPRLAPGDLLEYRVITTVRHHPLAPTSGSTTPSDRAGIVTGSTSKLMSCFQHVQLHVQPEFTYEIIESENRHRCPSRLPLEAHWPLPKEPLPKDSDVL